jgi:hypothetical protein
VPRVRRVGPLCSDRFNARSLINVSTVSFSKQAGILREATGRQRGKLYVYDKYLAILNEGTEPEE